MQTKPHTERAFYRLGYTARAFGALTHVARVLPRPLSRSIARAMGHIYAHTQPGIVEVVRKNIALLAPAMAQTDCAQRVFVNYAATLADYLWLAARPSAAGFSLAVTDGGIDHIHDAMAGGGGAILATGHFGFFEFGALVLGHMGFPVTVVTLPEPSRELTRWRAEYRLRWGAQTIELAADPFSSLRVNEALDAGRLTAMLIDRPAGGRSTPVDLPGGRIAFSAAPALVAWMSGRAILPVGVRSLPDGRYSIHAGEAVRCDRSLGRDAAIKDCTQRVAGALVTGFLEDPLQWYHFVPLAGS